MVVQNPPPQQPQHSGPGHPSKEDVVFMMNFVMLQTQARDYETPPPKTPSNNDAPESS